MAFPIYVRDDAGDVAAYPSLEAMQGYLEAIDVEHNEYEAWDADGHVLRLAVGKPRSQWLKVTTLETLLSESEFAEIKSKAVPYRSPESLLKSLGRVLGSSKTEC